MSQIFILDSLHADLSPGHISHQLLGAYSPDSSWEMSPLPALKGIGFGLGCRTIPLFHKLIEFVYGAPHTGFAYAVMCSFVGLHKTKKGPLGPSDNASFTFSNALLFHALPSH